MKPVSVLYISYDGIFDPVGASQILPYLKGLQQSGATMYLISFEKEDKSKAAAAEIDALLRDTNIRWFPCTYTKTPPVFSTLKDVRVMIQLAKRICKDYKIDIVHARSYIPAMAAQSMKRKFGIPFIFDMRGFWADERIDGHIWNLRNPLYNLIYRYFKRKEASLSADADSIVSLTHAAKDYMVDAWKIPHEKISVIPCAADYALFQQVSTSQRDDFMLKHNIKNVDGKTLMYIGSTGTWYCVKEMAEFYAVFRKIFPGSRFILCVNEAHYLVEKLQFDFPDEVFVLEKVSRKDMPVVLSLADYSIMFIKNAFSKKASSPIKLGESLAMGIPVICNAGVGDLGTVERDGFGVVVQDLSEKEYEAACERLRNQVFQPAEIRTRSEKEYGLSENIRKYEAVYMRLKNRNT